MKVRKIASTLPMMMAVAALQPLGAQSTSGHQWTVNRPDGLGPISLTESLTLPAGEFQLSVKYVSDRFKGLGLGSDSLTLNEALAFFTVAPTEMVSRGAEVNLMVGLTRHLTLSATGTFVQKKMNMVVADPGNPNLYWIGQTESMGPEDVKVSALYNVFDQGGVRVHFQGGVSIPLGLIDFDDATLDPLNPGSGVSEVQLPYQQQLGSGTFDALPGVTATVQNEVASLGFQAKAVIRFTENNRGWTLGDVYTGTLWGAYKASDWASASVGARYTSWGNVEGFDEILLTSTDLAYDSPAYNGLQSGSRIEIPLGLNFFLSEGRFQGHRFGIEFLVPVDQSLNYTQFRRDWNVVFGWQKAVSF